MTGQFKSFFGKSTEEQVQANSRKNAEIRAKAAAFEATLRNNTCNTHGT
jgi:hypothetical protein